MAKPPTAQAFSQALDPSDELDFYIVLGQGAPDAVPAMMLLTGEGVASYSLALSTEAIAAGLEIMDGVGEDGVDRTNRLSGNELTVWFRVAGEARGASIFDGAGVSFGVEIAIVTTAGRKKQRTFLVRIANQ